MVEGTPRSSAACCWLSLGAQLGLSAGAPTHGPCFGRAHSMAAGFQGWAAQETVQQMLYLPLYFSFWLHVMSPPTSFFSLDPGDKGQFTFKGRKINLMLHFFMGVVSENLWVYFKSTHHGNSQSRKLWEASRYCRGGWLSIQQWRTLTSDFRMMCSKNKQADSRPGHSGGAEPL